MSWFGIGAAVVAVVGTAASAYEQNKASNAAAAVDTATADYNAKYDASMAEQLDLDTIQNIRTQRQNDSVYLSKQAAGYASAGVLSTTGSALHAQITNAGRFEQQIQQAWVNSQQQQQQYYSKAAVGLLEGQAQASADRLTGSIALINGATKIAGMVAGDYESGLFSGLSGLPSEQQAFNAGVDTE